MERRRTGTWKSLLSGIVCSFAIISILGGIDDPTLRRQVALGVFLGLAALGLLLLAIRAIYRAYS